MKVDIFGVVLVSILSIATASDQHRLPHDGLDRIRVERVHRSPKSKSTRQQVQRILARYSTQSSKKVRAVAGTRSGGTKHYQPHRQKQQSRQQEHRAEQTVRLEEVTADNDQSLGDPFEAAARRSKQIDAGRVPIEYYPSESGQVGIGTPNQHFNIEFDIGSSDTWVMVANANCSHHKKCSKDRKAFVPEQSGTFNKQPDLPWTLDFSDGFQDRGIDGSFGLGFTELTYHGDRTPIDNLIRAGSMRSEVGVWLGRGNQGGELIFGGRDRARYYGDITYYNVTKGSAYWAILVESITVVSNQLNDDGTDQRTFRSDTIPSIIGNTTIPPNVIFDTSANTILLPPSIALQVHRRLHNYFFGFYSGYSLIFGLYTVPCNLVDMEADVWIDLGPPVPKATIPPVPNPKPTITTTTTVDGKKRPTPSPPSRGPPQPPRVRGKDEGVEGAAMPTTKFRISGRDIVRERLPVVGGIMDVCFSGIQASKSDSDDWVFGSIWFMNNYMTFDHRYRQIGVAPAVQLE
ncbi:MAG: aspartic peptidase domain-containing protein [Benniella sp.]|nr:MAG: aspartic peptidase domain-containing protein [Benniella sp.]